MSDKKPDSIYKASGAQPAEVELTVDDMKKFNLFTQMEIDRMENWELEIIRRTPLALLVDLVDAIREQQIERKLQQLPKKSPNN